MILINQIASDEVLEAAYQWLCAKRAYHHFNGDVWQVKRWWQEKKPLLQQLLRSGRYQFRELRLIRGEERIIESWSSQDALVLKAMSLVLTVHLKPHLSKRCFHLAGTGGLKGAVREVTANVKEYDFVFRTVVKGYYARRRVGWANYHHLAISSGIMSICPPYKNGDRTSTPGGIHILQVCPFYLRSTVPLAHPRPKIPAILG